MAEVTPVSHNDQETPLKVPPHPKTSGDHPRRFDQATYNQIRGLDARLLEAIAFDCKLQAKRSPTGAKYSLKSQSYFAKMLGVCRETISDRIRHLERIGILDVTRRGQKNGVWQTNMYKIRSWIFWRLAKCLRSLRATPQRVTKPPHYSTPMREKKDHKALEGGPIGHFTKEILARWEQRGLVKAQSPT